MALFNRKKDDHDVLPAEVRDYYKSEQRTRTGKAWILAVVTLLVTFLIAAALFFGGRWVYRTIFSNDEEATTSQEASENSETASEQSPAQSEGRDDPSALDGNTSSTNTTATPPAAPAPTPTSQTVPATGPSQLVNTGPGDEL